jgi:hypothetical protein
MMAIAQVLGVACMVAGLGSLDSRIPVAVALSLASACALFAVAIGFAGVSFLFALAGSIPAEDDFWRARMTAERFRWRDLIATHDPVAGPLDAYIEVARVGQLRLRSYLSTTPPAFGTVPHTRLVTNWRSLLRDHTSYLANREECVASLVFECARLDASGSHEWLAPDPERIGIDPRGGVVPPISEARRRIVKRWKWLEAGWTLVVLATAWLHFNQTLATRQWNVDSWTAALRAATSIAGSIDFALAVVLVSMWRALSMAGKYSLDRLTAAILDSTDDLHRVAAAPTASDRDFHRLGSFGRAELLTLSLSGGLPLLVFVLLRQTVSGWTLSLATLIAAAMGALGSEFICAYHRGHARKLRRETDAAK